MLEGRPGRRYAGVDVFSLPPGRVAKSKFRKMPLFAKSDTGYIALQGDHGQVSFRNVKIRPIKVEK